MKLKYYMRGLGIGICLTTLILTIGSPKEKLSDDEIIQRAQALGMKMQDETDVNLNKVLKEIDLTGTPTPPITVNPTLQPTIAPTIEPTVPPTAVPKPTAAPEVKAKDISFTITKGMTSDSVANLLKKVGLIKDADDFNHYIVGAGKASIIRVGDYTLPKGSSYDEIIKKITRKQ